MGMWQGLTSRISKSQQQRAVIIGLDGVPYTLLQRFIKEGVMPNLAQIVREGTFSQMDTSIPEISSVAWSSFFTGVNPAKHGIYGFMDLRPESYDMYFPNSHHVQVQTLWDVLGQHNKRSVVINVPSTYSAKPLNGILVAGFVAIDLAKATYPPSLVPMLEQSGYQLDVDATKAQESLDLFAEDLISSLESREQVLWRLLEEESWDLFIGVITETDRMQHYLWAAIEDPGHSYHEFFKSIYRKVDEFIGKVYDWFQGKGLFMIMSDHGFCQIQSEIHVNEWLKSEDYLTFAKTPPQSLQDLGSKTRAFTIDPGRIYIHLKERYPNGSVSPGDEYDRLREELKDRLLRFTVNGSRIVNKVFFKEEVYHGPVLNMAPDLILLPNRTFDLKGSVSKGILAGNSLLTGMHTQDDAVIYINRPISKEGKVNIIDITPTVLSYLGVPIPQEIDGAVFIEG